MPTTMEAATTTIPDPPWTLEIRPEERLLHVDFAELMLRRRSAH